MMRPKLLIILPIVSSILITTTAHSQTDVCAVALKEQAYDRVDTSKQIDILVAKKSDLCDKQYSSLEEARGEARQSGFNLGYSGFTIGASDAKQETSGKVSISNTSFCTSKVSDMRYSFSSDYSSQVASVAVNAWLECVKISRQNVLYLDYGISDDGRLFSGTLHLTATTGRLERTITGIATDPSSRSKVQCNIGGDPYRPKDVSKTSIEVETTGTAIICEKSKDHIESIIAIQTSNGSLPPITLHSKSAREQIQLSELKKRIQSLEQQAVRKGTIVATEQECSSLGDRWEVYNKAQGRVIVGSGKGIDDGMGEKVFVLSEIGGDYMVKLAHDQLPLHVHKGTTVKAGKVNLRVVQAAGIVTQPGHISGHAGKEPYADVVVEPPDHHIHNFTTNGGEGLVARAHKNVQPYVSLNYCIKR